MPDHVLRGMFRSLGIRVVLSDTTTLTQEALRRQAHSPIASIALARALTGAALLGAGLKADQRLGIQFSGKGVLRSLFADADSHGNLRGYTGKANAFRDAPRAKLAEAIGAQGTLSILLDDGRGEFYRGLTNLVSGTIDADLEHHLSNSEQVPSRVALGAWYHEGALQAAAGVMLQLMPGADPGNLARFQDTISSEQLEQRLAQGLRGVDALASWLAESDSSLELLELPRELRFHCPCTRERAERALRTLDAAALDEIIQEDKQAEVSCQFCGAQQFFTLEDLLAIQAERRPLGDAE